MSKSILIIEDDLSFAHILQNFLVKKGYKVETVYNLKRANEVWGAQLFDLVIADYRLPDGTGLEMLQNLRNKGHKIPFIIMTAFHDIRTAVRSMKSGAFDYITKPVNPDELLMLVESGFKQTTETISTTSKTTNQSTNTFIKGISAESKQLHEYLELVAPTNMSVIIQGESGTGKEYVARTIHQLSKRANKPFVAIDCGTLSTDLAASELFGHIKGAFTGALQNKTGQLEYANGGTLFLDEIGNLSYEVQIKLLRALQEKIIQPMGSNQTIAVDVRILAATNDDLYANVKASKFREDLFHRLNEFGVKTPPLRNRLNDMDLFVQHFITQANTDLNKSTKGLSDEVMTAFKQYDWPGNLRELRNVVRRAVLLSKQDVITLDVLPDEMRHQTIKTNTLADDEKEIGLKAVEKELIEKTLAEVKYNKTKAAKLLNIDRKTLYNKMQKYNL